MYRAVDGAFCVSSRPLHIGHELEFVRRPIAFFNGYSFVQFGTNANSSPVWMGLGSEHSLWSGAVVSGFNFGHFSTECWQAVSIHARKKPDAIGIAWAFICGTRNGYLHNSTRADKFVGRSISQKCATKNAHKNNSARHFQIWMVLQLMPKVETCRETGCQIDEKKSLHCDKREQS